MNKVTVVLSLLLGLAVSAPQDHWAVIVAGSNGYWNYRHQADACHAYQIMKRNGIPEDQIVLMAYDDIAYSSNNPYKGQLFNKPDGEDVYAGCNIDYKGKDVTPEVFMSVMTGDASAVSGKGNEKVLKSNSKSRIFVFFTDHGAPGLIAFPSTYLYADKLHATIKTMNSKKMYNEMVMYIEACESGSMFENILEDNLNVYAVSASNSHESSWGTYCPPQDSVKGVHMRTCLGDLFSVNWMENADMYE